MDDIERKFFSLLLLMYIGLAAILVVMVFMRVGQIEQEDRIEMKVDSLLDDYQSI